MHCTFNAAAICTVCERPTRFPNGNRACCGHPGCVPSVAFSTATLSARITYGPGTELKKLLATIGITASPACSCNARAAEMDRKGCDWCEENIDTIVGWLREEATKRRLPFLDAAGRLLVKRAIRNARKAAS
jgi:hypothetical protein